MKNTQNFKEYILSQIIGKHLRIKCDCDIPMDVTGIIMQFKIVGADAIIYVSRDTDKKIVPITLNHPNMTVEEL